MTRCWLILGVLVAPLAVVPGWDLPAMKNDAFLLLGAGAAIVLVRNRWVGLFTGWTVVAALLTGAAPWAVRGAVGVLAWALVYHLATTLTETGWRSVRVAVTVAAVFQLLWLGVQAVHADPLFFPLASQGGVVAPSVGLVGWFGNPMDLALYLALALPLIAAVHPLIALVAAAVMLTALHVTVGALGVAVTGLWVGLRALPTWWLRAGLVGLVVAAGFAYLWRYDAQGAGLKPLVWSQTLQLIRAKPLIGWGPNAFDHSVFILTPQIANYWNFVFNEYLQGWLELGAIGLVPVAGYLATLGWKLRRCWRAAGELIPALAILLITAAVSIPMRIGPVALLAALVLGRLEAVTREVT